MLLSAPNFSEGRSERVVGAIGMTLGSHARLLNTHFDAAHNRSVYTLCGEPGELEDSLLGGAQHAIELIDLRGYQGLHPHIGALDVSPVIWLYEDDHAAARAAALSVADGIGERGIPVFLYGELASSDERRERSFFRQGGPAALTRRMESGELMPDRGPGTPHPTAGATLVGARKPLVAFNLELDTPNPEVARMVAESLRESGGGRVGVRAIGLPWHGDRSQVSINVHDPFAVKLADVVADVQRLAAEHGARVVDAELVGLAPEIALKGYPEDPPIRDFDPAQHVIERVTGIG